MDEKLPKLPEFECSQSLQDVDAELAAVNGLFRLSNRSHLNLQMDEPEDTLTLLATCINLGNK